MKKKKTIKNILVGLVVVILTVYSINIYNKYQAFNNKTTAIQHIEVI